MLPQPLEGRFDRGRRQLEQAACCGEHFIDGGEGGIHQAADRARNPKAAAMLFSGGIISIDDVR